MRHAAILAAVLLSGVLFIPWNAQGQSHSSAPSSAAPAWVEHTWEEGSSVLPYAIDVNDEDEVYVTKVVQGRRLSLFLWKKESLTAYKAVLSTYKATLLSATTPTVRCAGNGKEAPPVRKRDFSNAFVGYNIAVRDDRIYTNEGTPIYAFQAMSLISPTAVL